MIFGVCQVNTIGVNQSRDTHLVKFQAHQTSHKRGSCGDGGDDLPGDLLCRVAIGNRNTIIHCAKVGTRGNEVNMMIRVIILLKIYRREAVSRKRGGRRQFLRRFRQIIDVCTKRVLLDDT
jgi:hypothetical protein